MRTFLEYVSFKNFEQIIQEVNIEAENNSKLNQILIDEGFWGNVGQGIKNFAQGAWGGVKTGAQVGWSQMTGPATQFQNALNALTKAIQAISSNDQWKQSKTSDGKGLLIQWLQAQVAELQTQIKQFQRLKII